MRTWKKIVAATMVAMMMVSNVQPVVTVRAAEEVCEEATIESTTELQTESTQEDATMEETTDESSTEEEPTVEVTTEEEATEDNSTTEVTTEEVITEEGSTEEVSTEEVTTEDIPTEEDTEESELREREYGVVYGSDGLPVMIEMTPELAEALNDQEQQDIANGFVTKEESKNFEAHRVTRNSQVGEKMSLRFMNRFGINKLYVEGIYNGRAITSEEAEMMYVEQGGTARTVFCLEFGVTASKGDTLEMQDGMQLFKKLDDTQKDNVKHATITGYAG